MKVYQKSGKSVRGWGYWGDNGEIEAGVSSGYFAKKADFRKDEPHFHKRGTVYILTLEGAGRLNIAGTEILHTKDSLVRIDAGETYFHCEIDEAPLSWITFCTVKDPLDKLVV